MTEFLGPQMKHCIFVLLFFSINLLGCNQPKTESLQVQPLFQEKRFNCQSVIKQNAKTWHLSQVYLFASEIEYQNNQGNWQTLPLADNKYQSQQIVLLGVDCQHNAKGQWQLRLTDQVKREQIKALRFQVGIPFTLNHLNPLQQNSPLNIPNMFWVWQTGHKFVRMEMTSAASDHWLFHLGSVGCSSVSALRSPKQPCLYPNTFKVTLAKLANNSFSLNLTSWFQGLTFDTATGCQSEITNPYCQLIFNNVGINNRLKR